MIHVDIRYFSLLAVHAGTKHREIDLPDGCTMAELFPILAEGGPPAFQDMLLNHGRNNPHLRVFRNGSMFSGEELNKTLADGDRLLIFPALEGG